MRRSKGSRVIPWHLRGVGVAGFTRRSIARANPALPRLAPTHRFGPQFGNEGEVGVDELLRQTHQFQHDHNDPRRAG
jgi:hypothetical protein